MDNLHQVSALWSHAASDVSSVHISNLHNAYVWPHQTLHYVMASILLLRCALDSSTAWFLRVVLPDKVSFTT